MGNNKLFFLMTLLALVVGALAVVPLDCEESNDETSDSEETASNFPADYIEAAMAKGETPSCAEAYAYLYECPGIAEGTGREQDEATRLCEAEAEPYGTWLYSCAADHFGDCQESWNCITHFLPPV